MPFVYEKEEVLVGVESLGYEDIADKWKGVICRGNLKLVVGFNVLDDLCFTVHVSVNSKKLWITCRLVVDQADEWHSKYGVTWLLNCKCCGSTSSDAFVEHAVGWYLRHSV